MSWLLLGFIGWQFGPGFDVVLNEFWLFVSGGIAEVPVNNTTFLMMFPLILSVVFLEFPINIGLAVGASKIVGAPAREAGSSLFERYSHGQLFKTFFLVVFIEELIFRQVLMGLPMYLSDSPVVFYLALVISSVTFGWVHLSNYKNPRDKQFIRVIPQTFGGFVLAYVFVKYGLAASTIAHFAMNALIFAMAKLQRTSLIDAITIGVNVLYAVIAWNMMDQPLADIMIWFSGEPIVALEGWEFNDYLIMGVFMGCVANVIADVLLYDKNLLQPDNSSSKGDSPDLLLLFVVLFLVLALGLGVVYGVYWLVGFAIVYVPLRILISAIVLKSFSNNYSLSAAQRTFWIGIPMSYIGICIIESIGFWPALGYVCASFAIGIPQFVLALMDD